MIQCTPPTPRRPWAAVLLFAVVLVVFLFLISACGSDHDTAPKPAPVTIQTSLHEPPAITRIDMGQDTGDVKVTCWNGHRIFIAASSQPGYSSEYKNGGLVVALDHRCDDEAG